MLTRAEKKIDELDDATKCGATSRNLGPGGAVASTRNNFLVPAIHTTGMTEMEPKSWNDAIDPIY